MIFFSKFGCTYKNHRHIHAITIVYAHGKISVRFAHINTRWTVSNRSYGLVKLGHITDPNHRTKDTYPPRSKFSLEFRIRYFPNGNKATFKFSYLKIFTNLLMIAYIIEIQKSKFAYIQLREIDDSEPGC